MSKFVVKCRYEKTLENGLMKSVTEQYLVSALTCSDAETIVAENLLPYYSDMEISSVQEKRISEVIENTEAETFYLAKIAYITLDEKSGNEKKTPCNWLVKAADFADAHEIVKRTIDKSMSDIEVLSLSKTNIVDYYEEKTDA